MRVQTIARRLLCLLPLLMFATATRGAAIERGTAMTDPQILRALDASGLSLARLLGVDGDASGAALFGLPSMTGLRDATDRDFNAYVLSRKDAHEQLSLFDRDALSAQATRFDLTGIVNRMDRAYVAPDTCGEIRLIYRPIANHDSTTKEIPPSRLPVTLSLVMKAKPANADISCAELAKRWLALSDGPPVETATLGAKGGALEWMSRESIDRIEINIQVARSAANANDVEGRADYLMKVFRFDPKQQRFVESPMENQIDIYRLRADPQLAADFKQWLLDPVRMADLDRGTIVLPGRFLAMNVISETPAQHNADTTARDLLADDEIVAALANASARAPLENMLSPAGFARRLDDITCAGCHRTRAIGGFHFTGVERAGASNSAVVAAASPHFFGDQERRRDILNAFRDGKPPDLSRGFSARPQARRAKELIGTTYGDGWGAQCSVADADGARDKSFDSWICAEGLTCQSAPGVKDSRAGFCFLKSE